jgi:PPOX class probable F420-dependent enzyme
MPMRSRGLVGRLLDPDVANLLHRVRLGRWRVVVEEAGSAAEALDAEELLGVEATVRPAELGVALVRNLAALEVEHPVHYHRVVVDEATEVGARVAARLRGDLVAWLVTVSADATPVPTPIWFLWDDDTILVYSQPGKPKLRHIAANPRVSLNFHTSQDGGNVVVFTGEARVAEAAPPEARMAEYVAKYGEGIKRIGMTPEQMAATYSTVILVTPDKVRGF